MGERIRHLPRSEARAVNLALGLARKTEPTLTREAFLKQWALEREVLKINGRDKNTLPGGSCAITLKYCSDWREVRWQHVPQPNCKQCPSYAEYMGRRRIEDGLEY